MRYLTYRNNKTLQWDSLSLEDMQVQPMTHDNGGDVTRFYGLDKTGTKAYYNKVKYNLRDDIARRLRYRFYVYDLQTKESRELFVKWNRDAYQLNQFTEMSDGRYFVSATQTDGGVSHAYYVTWDGSEIEPLWEADGYPYSFRLSPDGTRFAYHMAGGSDRTLCPEGCWYAVNLMEGDGTRRFVYAEEGKLCFGPAWSPDGGAWLLFQIMDHRRKNRDYYFADIAVCRPDGSDFRRLTHGLIQYNNTSAGLRDFRTAGTNCPIWTPNGQVLYSKSLPDSHPDCHYDADMPNHEELIYDPSMGRGGCGLYVHDPATGKETAITEAIEGRWDFRPCLTCDGTLLVYTRAYFDRPTEIRLLDRRTGDDRLITRGTDDCGADYPGFLEIRT